MDKQKITKDKLLRLVATFRVLPHQWWSAIGKINGYSANNHNSFVYSAKKSKELHQVNDGIVGNYLYLTKKGYDNIAMDYPIYWNFEPYYDRPASNRSTSIITKRHTFLFFAFCYNYLINHQEPSYILCDFDEECKLIVGQYGKEQTIRPDGIIRANENENYYSLIAFEGDTGSEKIKMLFDKVFNYLIFTKQNFSNDDIQELKLYFCFRTNARKESVFDSQKGLIWQYFDQGGSFRSLFSTNKNFTETLDIRDLVKILNEQRFKIYVGTQTDPIESYQLVPIKKSIIDNCPKTANIYHKVKLDSPNNQDSIPTIVQSITNSGEFNL
jgi:hypothetical protein